MRKKEPWMKNRTLVTVFGREGVITRMEEGVRNGSDYVFNIRVRFEGEKLSSPFHPADVQPIILCVKNNSKKNR